MKKLLLALLSLGVMATALEVKAIHFKSDEVGLKDLPVIIASGILSGAVNIIHDCLNQDPVNQHKTLMQSNPGKSILNALIFAGLGASTAGVASIFFQNQNKNSKIHTVSRAITLSLMAAGVASMARLIGGRA